MTRKMILIVLALSLATVLAPQSVAAEEKASDIRPIGGLAFADEFQLTAIGHWYVILDAQCPTKI